MAALTKDRNTRVRAQGTNRHRTRKLGAVKVYKGGVAAVNTLGFLVPASDTAGLKVVGLFDETVDNSGGAAGDKEASYTTGIEVELDHAGVIVQATLIAVVADDQTVTTTAVATNDVPVGNVTEFTATKAWVFIDEAVNLAQ